MNYNPESWDSHYFTGLYSAIKIYLDDSFSDKSACKMAILQALYYFAAGVS
jgi:hypothetical protein